MSRPTTTNYALKKSLGSDPERASGLTEHWGPVMDANLDAIDAAIAAAALGESSLTVAANTVVAGPATGPDAAAAARLLVAADIPAIAESGVTNLVADLALKASLSVSINAQTDDYVLVLADAGKYVRMNKASANNLTVPTNASVAFPIGTSIAVRQVGAGVTTLVAAGGVTLHNPGSDLHFAKQNGTAQLIKVGADEWDIIGGTTGA